MLLTRPVSLLAAVLIVLAAAGGIVSLVTASSTAPAPSTVHAASTRAPKPGLPGSWALKFDDEFNGTRLNSAKWYPGRTTSTSSGDAPFNADQEQEFFFHGQVAVSDGRLHLSVAPAAKSINGVQYTFASGDVETHNRLLLDPSHTLWVQASMKMPKCDGCWPAFWLVSESGQYTEIDIAEMFDTATEARPTANYHYTSGNNVDQTGSIAYGRATADVRGTWAQYGMKITSQGFVPYLNGVAYPAAGRKLDPGDGPLELVIDLAVERGHHPPSGSQLAVDWVRVWQQKQ